MTKLALLYERQGTLYVRTSSQTTLGPWSAVGDCTVLSGDSPPEQIAESVRRHLAASTVGIPTPPKVEAKSHPLLRAAKVGSWRAFDKLAKLATVEANGDQLTITPHKSTRPGFVVIEGAAVTLPAESDARLLGESLQRALEASG